MVVNRKKLRNRIFKISFSFVISALAIVLGLSVRSNAKATTYKQCFLSDYNLHVGDQIDYNNANVLHNDIYYNWYIHNVPPSSYEQGYPSNYSDTACMMYNDFVMYVAHKSVLMYIPFKTIYVPDVSGNEEGRLVFPNSFTFYFGNILGGLNLDNYNINSFNLNIFYYPQYDLIENSNVNNFYRYYINNYNVPSYNSGGYDLYGDDIDSSFNLYGVIPSSNRYLDNNYVRFNQPYALGIETSYSLQSDFIKTIIRNGFTLYTDSYVSALYNASNSTFVHYGIVGVNLSFDCDDLFPDWTDINYNVGSLPFIKYDMVGSNDSYQAGYNDGVASVDTNTYYNNGFDRGYISGQNSVNVSNIAQDNYSAGYNAGLLASSHDYGIKDLLYSIFDVPINVLSNLFSFTIFGSNVWAIIVSLLTILVVIWIVSKVLGIVFGGGGKK